MRLHLKFLSLFLFFVFFVFNNSSFADKKKDEIDLSAGGFKTTTVKKKSTTKTEDKEEKAKVKMIEVPCPGNSTRNTTTRQCDCPEGTGWDRDLQLCKAWIGSNCSTESDCHSKLICARGYKKQPNRSDALSWKLVYRKYGFSDQNICVTQIVKDYWDNRHEKSKVLQKKYYFRGFFNNKTTEQGFPQKYCADGYGCTRISRIWIKCPPGGYKCSRRRGQDGLWRRVKQCTRWRCNRLIDNVARMRQVCKEIVSLQNKFNVKVRACGCADGTRFGKRSHWSGDAKRKNHILAVARGIITAEELKRVCPRAIIMNEGCGYGNRKKDRTGTYRYGVLEVVSSGNLGEPTDPLIVPQPYTPPPRQEVRYRAKRVTQNIYKVTTKQKVPQGMNVVNVFWLAPTFGYLLNVNDASHPLLLLNVRLGLEFTDVFGLNLEVGMFYDFISKRGPITYQWLIAANINVLRASWGSISLLPGVRYFAYGVADGNKAESIALGANIGVDFYIGDPRGSIDFMGSLSCQLGGTGRLTLPLSFNVACNAMVGIRWKPVRRLSRQQL